MNIFKKFTLTVFAVIFSLSLSLQSANAGKVTINLGHGGGEKSAYQPLAEKFAELAAKYSNGSLEVKVRCCAQLIKEDEAFKAMQLGTVDMRAELLLVSAIVGGAWRSARLTTVISDLFPIFELQECTTATRLAAAALGFAAS